MSALRDFVADLMDRQGAAVETLEPDGLAVIAPTEAIAPEEFAADSPVSGRPTPTEASQHKIPVAPITRK